MVDEQKMEIGVKLPADYPLHGVEVREIQKLGVEEKRWRGWLLAVQQIVTSQVSEGTRCKEIISHAMNRTGVSLMG